MTAPVIAFFNNKGGVGKTSAVYHVAWMLADLGYSVVAADLDPQSNLTASFLDEDRLQQLADNPRTVTTVFDAVQPLKDGTGDIASPHVEPIRARLGLVLGDLALSSFEDDLSEVWPKCLEGNLRAFLVTSAFWRVVQRAAAARGADVILIDLGPNLGAINRAALIATDFVVVPLGPDLFSLQGLRNLGPALLRWRTGWSRRLAERPATSPELPSGDMLPIGYMVLRHSIRLDRPVKAFERWMAQMPSTYAASVLPTGAPNSLTIDNDPNCIAKLKDFRSLMPLAQEARKPIFNLKPSDGAMGAHSIAVASAYSEFRIVAESIVGRAHLVQRGRQSTGPD